MVSLMHAKFIHLNGAFFENIFVYEKLSFFSKIDQILLKEMCISNYILAMHY